MSFSKWAAECKGKADPTYIGQLENFFGNRLLTGIDDRAVENYREKRRTEKTIRHEKASKVTVSQTTINKELTALRKLLRMARKKEIHNKVTVFPMAKEPSRKRTLEAEE